MLGFLTAIRGRFIADRYAGRLAENSKVLDVGCGSGIVAAILKERFRLDLTGADTARRLERDLPFVLIPEDGELPFAERTFAAAMLNDVLHHVRDQAGLLRRTLRTADQVLIFEVEPAGRLLSCFDRVINWLHYGGLPAPETYRDAAGWRRWLAETGFSGEVEPAGKPAWWYPFEHVIITVRHG